MYTVWNITIHFYCSLIKAISSRRFIYPRMRINGMVLSLYHEIKPHVTLTNQYMLH